MDLISIIRELGKNRLLTLYFFLIIGSLVIYFMSRLISIPITSPSLLVLALVINTILIIIVLIILFLNMKYIKLNIKKLFKDAKKYFKKLLKYLERYKNFINIIVFVLLIYTFVSLLNPSLSINNTDYIEIIILSLLGSLLILIPSGWWVIIEILFWIFIFIISKFNSICTFFLLIFYIILKLLHKNDLNRTKNAISYILAILAFMTINIYIINQLLQKINIEDFKDNQATLMTIKNILNTSPINATLSDSDQRQQYTSGPYLLLIIPVNSSLQCNFTGAVSPQKTNTTFSNSSANSTTPNSNQRQQYTSGPYLLLIIIGIFNFILGYHIFRLVWDITLRSPGTIYYLEKKKLEPLKCENIIEHKDFIVAFVKEKETHINKKYVVKIVYDLNPESHKRT